MRRGTHGFTAIELAISLSIVGIMTLMAMPRLASTLSTIGVQSAAQKVAATVVTARAVAVRSGRPTRVVLPGDNTIRITIDSAGTWVPVGPALDLYTADQATLSATRSEILFDPRGFAVGLNGPTKIFLSRDGARDSVCVAGLGRVSVKGCMP